MNPSQSSTSKIETQTKAMFTRVLSGWALDLLELRRSGLIVPGQREGTPDLVTPDFGDRPSLNHSLRWRSDVASALRWRPQRSAA
jgi:hypothetical protein